MLLADVVQTSLAVAATRSRKQKIDRLADCLRRARPEEIETVVGLLSGALCQGKVGVGFAVLRDVDPEPAQVPAVTVGELDRAVTELAELSGRGVRAARLAALGALFARSTADEQVFLRQLLGGELRQGALAGVMGDAIAAAFDVAAAAVRRAAMLAGDLGAVARRAADQGESGLAGFMLQIFRPLQPMLAQPGEDLQAAMARLGEAALEWKLDGARVQVHREGDQVRVFTRTLNEVTDAVPEVVEAALALPVERAVLDGEVVALREDGRPQPFQVTMRRFGRRLDIDALRRELPVQALYFDCLHLEGRDLLSEPGGARRAAMAACLPEQALVPRTVTSDPAEGEAFFAGALRAGHEGVMVKSLETEYEAGRRGAGWLKVKPVHTLDLVVLAAEWGSGRRRGWLSNLHLGARDPASGGFVMLGKTFKGLTDATLTWQTARLQELETERDRRVVRVRPELVVEIAFDGVQESPHYPGGLALRFARVKRYRPDKSALDADTIDAVRALWHGIGESDA